MQQKSLKKLPQYLIFINKYLKAPTNKYQKLRYWCEDETRLGLKTIPGRLITLAGVKPVGAMQWRRDNFYLYGIVEPSTGEHFFWEFSHLDTVCFERFLTRFASTYSEDLHIVQVDNGAFHSSRHLRVPENVVLLFQPPHTPEVNPIERCGRKLKDI